MEDGMKAALMSRIDQSGECWMWQGMVTGRGYPRFWYKSVLYHSARKLVYEAVCGATPQMVNLRMTCGNTLCVRPDHMQRERKPPKNGYIPVGHPSHRWPERTVEERFWSKAAKSSECWMWQGAKRRPTAKYPQAMEYGLFAVKHGEPRLAHRFAYELTHGSIPDGMFVCHHCDNPSCVRPDHLFLGSPKDNAQDMASKGRHRSSARKVAS